MSTATGQDTRNRILAGARSHLINMAGATTMDEVAEAVGVGRATLYRYFKNRDDLLLTLLAEEGAMIAGVVAQRLRGIEEPASFVVEGMTEAWAEIRRNELISLLLLSGETASMYRLLFDSDRLVDIGLSILAPLAETAGGGADKEDAIDTGLLMEWLLRMLVSLLTIPSPQLKDKAAVRALLQATVAPVITAWG